jgi:hypothetical protein
MKAYRLYLIGKDGHFAGVQGIDAPEDEAAIAEAAQRCCQSNGNSSLA